MLATKLKSLIIFTSTNENMGYFKKFPLSKIVIPRDFLKVEESWAVYKFRLELLSSILPNRTKSHLGTRTRKVPYEQRLNILIDYLGRLEQSAPPSQQLYQDVLKKFEEYQPVFKKSGEYVPPNVLVIETGGTALCKPRPSDGFLEPLLTTEELLERMEKMHDIPDVNKWYRIKAERKEKIDSAHMLPPNQYENAEFIADRIRVHKPDGVVVIHGTDTMINSAHAWTFLMEDLHVPVVMTGAMIEGVKDDSDIFRNLGYACFYSSIAPIRPGIYISFGKELYEGSKTIHDETDPLRAFTVIMSGAEKGIERETIRGCSGMFHEFERPSEAKKILESFLSYRILDKEQWTSLTLSPRILDPRLKIPPDVESDSCNEIFDFVKKTLEKGYKLLPASYAYSTDPRIRMGKTRNPVFSLDVQPDSPIEKLLNDLFADSIRASSGGKTLNELSLNEIRANRISLPLENRPGLYIGGYSGTVKQNEELIKLMSLGVPIIFGTRVRGDRVRNFNIEAGYYTHKLLKSEDIQELVIHPEDMIKETALTKLSISTGELNTLIKQKGNQNLENPTEYLRIVKRIMLTNFEGEIEGEKSPEKLYDVIQEIVK